MKCPKCGSENVTVQTATTVTMSDKHRGCFWWLIVGWWWIPFKWIFLTLPALIFAIFSHKKQKMKSKTYSKAVCQNCGNQWNV